MHRILEKINPSFDFEILTAFQKDSLEITEADRSHLVKMIEQSDAKKFVITHGTDTMIETAQFIFSKIKNKTIVLTGAMRPERFTNSDAAANVGGAIIASQTLERGVYVLMNGIAKSWEKIRRDLGDGKFL